MTKRVKDLRQSVDNAANDLVLFLGWMILQQALAIVATLVGIAASGIDYAIKGTIERPWIGLTAGLIVYAVLSTRSLRGLNGNVLLMSCAALICLLSMLGAMVIHLLTS